MAADAMRRARFMMVLAYASDLATGQPRDFAMRSCVLAMRLARAAGVEEIEHRNVFHHALLRYIGCNADTHLLVAAFGDEFALRREVALADIGDPAHRAGVFRHALSRVHAGLAADDLTKAIENGLAGAPQVAVPILLGHCEVARRLSQRLGIPGDIREGLGQLYERIDGRGLPRGIAGDAVKFAVRLVTLAQDAINHADAKGLKGMKAAISTRSGQAYDSSLADVLLADAERLMRDLEDETNEESILSMEPQPHAALNSEECDEAFLAIADMVDMRMPHTMGHSRAVADLAENAARHMKLPDSDVRTIRRAALVHDIGELAVPVATWLKPRNFTARETDEARLHPYYSERALTALGDDGAAIAALVLRHHERLDGNGYHRRVHGGDLSPSARILAAVEAFQSAREARPHRTALTDAAAAARLRDLVREGKLCPDSTSAVLACAGQPSRRERGERLAGLSPREIEVLRLIVAGHTAKAAAQILDISPKTADNHIQNLYAKIGVGTRAGAALFAMEQGLVQHGLVERDLANRG